MAIDPKTGLNKAQDRRGTSPGSIAAARANARKVGSKKGEARALKSGAWASDATLEKLSAGGRTFEETAQILQAALEDSGTHSPAFALAAEQYLRDFHRFTFLSEQGGSLTVAATAERSELSRALTKQATVLLLTPESQHRAGVPDRKAAAERSAQFEKFNPSHKPEAERVQMIRVLIKAGRVPGACLIPLEGEPLDALFHGLVVRLVEEGRVPGAFLARVPDAYPEGQ
jgi:hypothetical protein